MIIIILKCYCMIRGLLHLWSLQIIITLTEGTLLIFITIEGQKLLACLGVKSRTFDLFSQSDAYDHSPMATPIFAFKNQSSPLGLGTKTNVNDFTKFQTLL